MNKAWADPRMRTGECDKDQAAASEGEAAASAGAATEAIVRRDSRGERRCRHKMIAWTRSSTRTDNGAYKGEVRGAGGRGGEPGCGGAGSGKGVGMRLDCDARERCGQVIVVIPCTPDHAP